MRRIKAKLHALAAPVAESKAVQADAEPAAKDVSASQKTVRTVLRFSTDLVTSFQSPGVSPKTLLCCHLDILISMPLEPFWQYVGSPLQTEQSAAALGFLALFRGISPAKSAGEGNSKRKRCTAAGSVGSASTVPAAESESDVERVVREQMERHRALRAQRKRRAVQREE